MKPKRRNAACSLLALVGVINVPIIHYSVEWWNTLHQGPTVTRFGRPAMDMDMLVPLLCAALGFTLIFGWLTLWGMRAQLLWRERRSRWVKRLFSDG